MNLITVIMIKKGTLELINNTPLVVLDKIVDGRVIYAKAEFMKPGGRAKLQRNLQKRLAGFTPVTLQVPMLLPL